MSNADWYARRLGTAPSPQPQSPLPPVVQPQQYPQQPQSYQQGPPMGYEPMTATPKFNSVAEALASGYAGTGAEAAKTQHNRCPNCGSQNFFTLSNAAVYGQGGAAVPAPHCFDCGYNHRFDLMGQSVA